MTIMKRVFFRYFALLMVFSTMSITSCIKNDIPYPVIELEITKVEGIGFTQKSIDTKNGIVTISLDETTDIRAVTISNVEYSEEANITNTVVGTFDMRDTISTTLYLYQSYNWSIVAEQTISREFKVVGQIGDERIDTAQCTVEVDVNEATIDLDNVTVTAMKLGPESITTYSPTLENLTNTSFNTVRRVSVTAHDREETWSIYLIPIEAEVTLTADAWGTIAWLSAVGDTSDPDICSFAYRKSGDSDWIKIAATDIGSGTFSAKVIGLDPSTDYDFEAYVGDKNSGSVTKTTESTPQLPNTDFEGWQQPSKAWFPYAEGDAAFWGTGNEGATTLSDKSNITLPDSDTAPGSTGIYSALMSSSSIFGTFAAGNIFTGRFIGTAGTNGIIGFGRPFTQRPIALRGWMKYTPGTVTHNDSNNKLEKGDSDQSSLYIALGTWSASDYGYDSTGTLRGDNETPIVIDTRDKSTFFDTTSSDIIAYGELIYSEATDGWIEFEIELEYRDLVDSSGNVITGAHSRVPTHIVVVGSSSRYGDYFTGSSSSKMWIDDFELIYE